MPCAGLCSQDVQRGEDRETSSSENNGNEAAVGTVAASVDLKASVPGEMVLLVEEN